MKEPASRRGGITGRLGFRLAFLLAVALLPLGLIAAIQSSTLSGEVRGHAEETLLGRTRAAASIELTLIQKAQGAAEALSHVVRSLPQTETGCSILMRSLVEGSDAFSFAGYIGSDGMIYCSSLDAPFDFSASPYYAALLADPKPEVNVNPNSSISGNSVLYATHPLISDSGAIIGFSTIAIQHDTLGPLTTTTRDDGQLYLMTFDDDGEVLTSSSGMSNIDQHLPANRALKAFVGSQPLAFTAEAANGEVRTFAIVPLVSERLYALGSWRSDEVWQRGPLSVLPPATVPILMFLVSLAVAMIAAEKLVVQHIRKLTHAITSFAGGSRMVGDLNLRSAPSEISEAGETFERMADSILRDEAELEDIVHQKEVLLREVHHRVKNNLQLIASIMNMQSRQARTPEARGMIKRLQERVMSLATIHRGLYQTTGVADVRSNELLPDIVRQIVNMASAPGRRFDVTTDFDDIRLTPDQAVPLALLLTEAMTNAMKYAWGAGDAPASLQISLKRHGEAGAVLEIANSVAIHDRTDEIGEAGTGFGTKLINAFAQQLAAEIERTETTERYSLSISFALRPLSAAEERADQLALAGTV